MDITSRKNDKIAHFRKLASSADYRWERGEFLCDGAKLLEEAAAHGLDIRDVLYSGDAPDIGLPKTARLYCASREAIEAASPMKTPQTVVFSAAIPKLPRPKGFGGFIVLENVQDPGNVGTVVRTASAFGLAGVALIGACADEWSWKTIRASMGAMFRIPVIRTELPELLREKNAPLYAAALRRGAEDIRDVDLTGAVVAIGNEGAGLSEELIASADGRVVIPMAPGCESLNAAAAAAVFAWRMAGRLL